MPTTLYPAFSSSSANPLPMKPATPVTNTLFPIVIIIVHRLFFKKKHSPYLKLSVIVNDYANCKKQFAKVYHYQPLMTDKNKHILVNNSITSTTVAKTK